MYLYGNKYRISVGRTGNRDKNLSRAARTIVGVEILYFISFEIRLCVYIYIYCSSFGGENFQMRHRIPAAAEKLYANKEKNNERKKEIKKKKIKVRT